MIGGGAQTEAGFLALPREIGWRRGLEERGGPRSSSIFGSGLCYDFIDDPESALTEHSGFFEKNPSQPELVRVFGTLLPPNCSGGPGCLPATASTTPFTATTAAAALRRRAATLDARGSRGRGPCSATIAVAPK